MEQDLSLEEWTQDQLHKVLDLAQSLADALEELHQLSGIKHGSSALEDWRDYTKSRVRE